MGKIGSLKIKSIDELSATNSNTNVAPTTAISSREATTFIVIDSDSGDECRLIHAIEKPALKRKSTKKISTAKKDRTVKKSARTSKKEPLPNQTKIDNFFKSGTKSWEPTKTVATTESANNGRKVLLEDEMEIETNTSASCFGARNTLPASRKRSAGGSVETMKRNKSLKITPVKAKQQEEQCIDLCSDSEEESRLHDEREVEVQKKQEELKESAQMNSDRGKQLDKDHNSQVPGTEKTASHSDWVYTLEAPTQRAIGEVAKERTYFQQQTTGNCGRPRLAGDRINNLWRNPHSGATTTTISAATHPTYNDDEVIEIDLTDFDDEELLEFNADNCSITSTSLHSEVSPIKPNGVRTRTAKKYPCPPYKKIAGTTFAVDAFRYGKLKGVTHYFLTHFHTDHYIGLTRKFDMPLYLSPMTARLVRTFIRLEEQYIHELELNRPQMVEGVQVTAIDANHCPGAVMFVFKLPDGKCILHTGDFRASADMESEPIFWNNDIHTIYLDTTYLFDTIYLDTTYLSDKYNFHTQSESIHLAKDVIRKFQANNADKRILYVCGSYLVGKERFWKALASEFKLTVWAHKNRRKALDAIKCEEIQNMLCDKPQQANFHILPWKLLHYRAMVDYFKNFSNQYDTLLALRPSGLATKLKYRGKVNIAGVQFLQHSSNNELKRFVMFLKPKEVISTVPDGKDPMRTPEIPQKWYRYKSLSAMKRNFQPTITSYLKLNKRKGCRAPENSNAKSLIRKKLSRDVVTAAAVAKESVVIDIQRTPPKAKSNDCDEKQTKHQKMPLADNVLHSVEKTPMTPKSSTLSSFDYTQDAIAGSDAVSPVKIKENFHYYGNGDVFNEWFS